MMQLNGEPGTYNNWSTVLSACAVEDWFQNKAICSFGAILQFRVMVTESQVHLVFTHNHRRRAPLMSKATQELRKKETLQYISSRSIRE